MKPESVVANPKAKRIEMKQIAAYVYSLYSVQSSSYSEDCMNSSVYTQTGFYICTVSALSSGTF